MTDKSVIAYSIVNIHTLLVKEALHCIPWDSCRPEPPFFDERATKQTILPQLNECLEHTKARVANDIPGSVKIRLQHAEQQSGSLAILLELLSNLGRRILTFHQLDRNHDVAQGTNTPCGIHFRMGGASSDRISIQGRSTCCAILTCSRRDKSPIRRGIWQPCGRSTP